jgi:archaellum component FlaC
MNEIQKFREAMAERGYEYTPKEAEQLMFNAENLVKIFSTYNTHQLLTLIENLEKDREEVKTELNWDDEDLDDMIDLIRFFYD